MRQKKSEFDLREFYPGVRELCTSSVFLDRKGILGAVLRNKTDIQGVVLDYGCGVRPYEKLFNVDQYLGADIAVSGHDSAAKKIDILINADGTVPRPDGSFDSVIATEVLEHVPDLQLCLCEFARLLKPGGTLFCTTPFVWPEHEVPFDTARYTRFSLEAQLNKAGFKLKNVEKCGGEWRMICQMMLLYSVGRTHSTIFRLMPFRLFGNPLRLFFCTLLNLVGLCGRGVAKPATGMYLTTVFLAEKLP